MPREHTSIFRAAGGTGILVLLRALELLGEFERPEVRPLELPGEFERPQMWQLGARLV